MENIRNNIHNSKVVYHFYKAAKTYDICEFNDHFNQIRDLVPKATEALERILKKIFQLIYLENIPEFDERSSQD